VVPAAPFEPAAPLASGATLTLPHPNTHSASAATPQEVVRMPRTGSTTRAASQAAGDAKIVDARPDVAVVPASRI
jgi:hypothetical protein